MEYKKIGETYYVMKRLAIICMLFMPLVAWAQKQYYLPTAGTADDEKDKPMIEVYLPQQPNGCAVVLCPGGAMRWLSWESDGKGPYELMPQTDETTTETWSSQMIHWLKAKGFISSILPK